MIGRVLGGRYEILEAVDSGGMAYIYKALCRKTKNIVAVKVLKEELSTDAESIKRFKKEAQAVFALEHENIIKVSDIGFDNGTYYMVMEYVSGCTLKSLIEESGTIPETEAILFGMQICSALAAAHRRGIIHRDIKPQNILLEHGEIVKVTDFGIAKSLSAAQEEEKEVVGSVYYVSPEQARGEIVDARSDIYSLGIMLYEMVTGQLPYKGDQTVSVALKHINEKITAPDRINPNISKSINNIILKATSKNKRDRYRSMDAFREDLISALVDTSGDFVDVPREPEMNVETSGKKNKNKLWKSIVLFGIIALMAGIVIAVLNLIQNANAQAIHLPDFRGKTVSEASAALSDMGLTAELEFQQSSTAVNGTVITQLPVAGSGVLKGSIVRLVVSNGPVGLEMPDVSGLSLGEASEMIESMGLKIGAISYDQTSDMPKDTVISQEPGANSILTGDIPVTLVVSAQTEKDAVPMPLLIGQNVEQAVTRLYGMGFTNCFVYEEENAQPEATVFDQSPAENVPTSLDDAVMLYISQYKQKDYHAVFYSTVDVPEKDMTIKVVLVSEQSGTTIDYVVSVSQATSIGPYNITLDIPSLSGGVKTVKVFVNDTEANSSEWEFIKRDAE